MYIMLNKILCKLPTHMLLAMTTYKFQSLIFQLAQVIMIASQNMVDLL